LTFKGNSSQIFGLVFQPALDLNTNSASNAEKGEQSNKIPDVPDVLIVCLLQVEMC